jgi:hypothetical protein
MKNSDVQKALKNSIVEHYYPAEMEDAAKNFMIEIFTSPVSHGSIPNLPLMMGAAMMVITKTAWIQPSQHQAHIATFDIPQTELDEEPEVGAE